MKILKMLKLNFNFNYYSQTKLIGIIQNFRFSSKSYDKNTPKVKLDYDNLELIMKSPVKLEMNKIKKFENKVKKLMIPSNCNLLELSKILNKDILELKIDYKKIVNYQIKDELEYLSRDDIELYTLEKNIPIEFLPYIQNIIERPIIVTIMGHVDHGKTTLLDTLRNSKKVDEEFGKITQGIGAFSIKSASGENITVIDTPGHEAFSKMRERGAKVTDCIILVVSCIEGAQKQTFEVINMAKNYKIPIIVALNKIDRIDNEQNSIVLTELKEHGLNLTKFGGKVPVCFISAKKRINIDLLENEILKLSKTINLKEDSNLPAQCYVIESRYGDDQNRTTATVIVKMGTLREGDYFICGETYGKIKSMINDSRIKVKEVSPGFAVEINGFKESPNSGSLMIVVDSQFEAERIIQERLKLKGDESNKQKKGIGLGIKIEKDTKKERFLLMRKGDSALLEKKISENKYKSELSQEEIQMIYLKFKDIPQTVIIRADTEGVLETIIDELNRVLGEELVKKFIISKKVGLITEDDFLFAKQANSTIFSFNFECTNIFEILSYTSKVGVRFHKLIYELVEEIRVFILEVSLKIAKFDLKIIKGRGIIQEVFKLKVNNKLSNVAGIKVEKGELFAAMKYRIIRENEVQETELTTSSFKKDKIQQTILNVDEEGGIIFEKFENFRVGDIIECYDIGTNINGISSCQKCVTCF